MNIVYAKKFRFPDQSANTTQGISTVCAFAEIGIPTDVFPCTTGLESDLGDYLESTFGVTRSANLRIHEFSPSNRKLYGPQLTASLAKRMCTPQNIFYAREKGIAARLLQWKRIFPWFKAKVVTEIHKFDAFHAEGKRRGQMEKRDNLLLHHSDGLVFISETLRQQAQDYIPFETPCCIAPSGYSPTFFHAVEQPEPSAPTVITYFGKITQDKGVEMLLQAFAKLANNFTLRVIGHVPDEQWVQDCLDQIPNVTQRIEFMGRLPLAEIRQALLGTTLVALPSVSRDKYLSPMKLVETLALGLPIVTTPLPHITEMLTHGQNAFIASGTAPEQYAEAIEHAVLALKSDSRMFSTMQQSSVELAKPYAWQARAKVIADFLRQLQI